MSQMPKLLPCPFCLSAVQFRKALWPSDGNTDTIMHVEPIECGLVDFSDGSTDESIIEKWNRHAVNSRDALVGALDDLQQAEAEFRLMLERYGPDGKATGLARDRLILVGDMARKALNALSQARS